MCGLLIFTPGDFPRLPKTAGPGNKKTVTKHATCSIRWHPAFIGLQWHPSHVTRRNRVGRILSLYKIVFHFKTRVGRILSLYKTLFYFKA